MTTFIEDLLKSNKQQYEGSKKAIQKNLESDNFTDFASLTNTLAIHYGMLEASELIVDHCLSVGLDSAISDLREVVCGYANPETHSRYHRDGMQEVLNILDRQYYLDGMTDNMSNKPEIKRIFHSTPEKILRAMAFGEYSESVGLPEDPMGKTTRSGLCIIVEGRDEKVTVFEYNNKEDAVEILNDAAAAYEEWLKEAEADSESNSY